VVVEVTNDLQRNRAGLLENYQTSGETEKQCSLEARAGECYLESFFLWDLMGHWSAITYNTRGTKDNSWVQRSQTSSKPREITSLESLNLKRIEVPGTPF